MKKFKAHCNNSITAIHKPQSSDIFEDILLKLDIYNSEMILKIFKKVKSRNKITRNEYEILLEVIENKDIEKLYNEVKKEFILINTNNIEPFKFDNIIESLSLLLYNSEVMGILDDDIASDLDLDDRYIKVLNGKKSKYYEIIEEKLDYIIGKDLRTDKYNLLSKNDNNKSIFASKHLFSLSKFIGLNIPLPEGILSIETECEKTNNCIIYNGNIVACSIESEFFTGKYAFYIVDPSLNLVVQFDKKKLKLKMLDFPNCNFIEIEQGSILYLLKPIQYNWEDDDGNTNNEITEGELSLYSLEKNKDILTNIHLKYYKIEDGILYCLSSDLFTFYNVDLKSGKQYKKNISDITGLSRYNGDELWDKLLDDLNE